MAWKICDGRLFGLKDPRDEDQTQVGKEALQKGRAGVVVRGKGFGTAERDLTPEELVDASLSFNEHCAKGIEPNHANIEKLF